MLCVRREKRVFIIGSAEALPIVCEVRSVRKREIRIQRERERERETEVTSPK